VQPLILITDETDEYFMEEGCHILELSNSAADEALSIARARVEPGVTTRLHRLADTAERYVILSGNGCVEVSGLPPAHVEAGNVVLIPPAVDQRITNTGDDDLVFLALCTPRFRQDNYADTEEEE
jgi:mannose-6-phosphate isomerase-like protein (cupin superfamily)